MSSDTLLLMNKSQEGWVFLSKNLTRPQEVNMSTMISLEDYLEQNYESGFDTSNDDEDRIPEKE